MKELTWADLGQQFDGPHATPKRKTDGPYFLNISSLENGRLDLSKSDRLSEDEFVTWTRRVIPQSGDLLYSYETRLGEAALMPDGIKACLGRRMALLRPNPEVVDPKFLLYFYLGPQFQRTIQKHTITGATVPRLLLSEMPSWTVVIPPLEEQRGIAEVLGALDDKIAANTTLITRCEALAHAKYTSAIRGGLARPLSELTRFVNGKAFTKDASGSGRVVIRIAELNSGLGASTVYNDIDVADDHVARPGDLLFAWSGSLTVHRWFRPEGIVNQHIFKVIPDQGFPMWLVHQALLRKLAEFRGIAADKATTMGHIQRRHLDEDVFIPAPDVITSLDQAMRGLWDRALAAEVENEQLSSTRDELLPLLMSGKVTVKDAEAVVGGVL